MSAVSVYDVVVVGGGPGGSATAAFLARAGLRVALFEREPFPRFHVGESLLPCALSLLDRLGAREAVEAHGFLPKHGAYFRDEESGLEQTFYFPKDRPWPGYAYEVTRADFDAVLLDHARKQGVTVFQPATVQSVAFDAQGVDVAATDGEGRLAVRASFLVDAAGRDAFLATRIGRRQRVPNLGKVALFAHFRGAERSTGIDEGNIRIYSFADGWFWYIPLASDLTSVGAVMHARTVRGREASIEALYADMIARCRGVSDGLRGAERVTSIHRVSNFAYVNEPIVGDRFLCVGDAVAFVDPIFSGGVFIAMQSGELAAKAILAAFADGRFEARRFRAYERAVWRGVRPFFKFIHKYYEPAFLELFLKPRNYLGIRDAVLMVLSGAAFLGLPLHRRLALDVLFGLARVNVWTRRRAGRPVESRLEW